MAGRRAVSSDRRRNKPSPAGVRKGEELQLRTSRTSYPIDLNQKDSSTPTRLREYVAGSVNAPFHDMIDPFRRLARTSYSTFPCERPSLVSARGGGFRTKSIMVCDKGHPATTEYIQVNSANTGRHGTDHSSVIPVEGVPERTYRSIDVVRGKGSAAATETRHRHHGDPYSRRDLAAGEATPSLKKDTTHKYTLVKSSERKMRKRNEMLPLNDAMFQAEKPPPRLRKRGDQRRVKANRQQRRQNRGRTSRRIDPESALTEATTMGTPTSMQLSDRTIFSSTGKDSNSDIESKHSRTRCVSSRSGESALTSGLSAEDALSEASSSESESEGEDGDMAINDARRHLLFKFLSKSMYCHVIQETGVWFIAHLRRKKARSFISNFCQ